MTHKLTPTLVEQIIGLFVLQRQSPHGFHWKDDIYFKGWYCWSFVQSKSLEVGICDKHTWADAFLIKGCGNIADKIEFFYSSWIFLLHF